VGLLDELAQDNYRPAKGPRCSVADLMERLDKKTLATFQAALANPAAPASHIADALDEMGYFMAGDTIRRHRKGRCRCGK